MTTSATVLLTCLRTWALVAGLTALVITLGALIGGTFRWLFAALAIIVNLVGYFWSDRIASGRRAAGDRASSRAGAAGQSRDRADVHHQSASGGQVSTLFSTHPPISERVLRLRAYDRGHARRLAEPRTTAAVAS